MFKASVFNGQGISFQGVTPALSEQPKGFDDFMVTARKRFQMAAEAEQPIRQEALEDQRFYFGEQWPDHIRQDRERAQRPCEVVNRLPQIVQQMTNQQRQNRPMAQINPVGSRADIKTAEIIQGLIRHTEINSDADIAYDTAFESAAICGFGYWRIRADYVDGDSSDQDIFDEWIDDAFSVYLDPTARKYDKSDMGFAFIMSDLTPDRFAYEFPGATMLGLDDFRSIGDMERFWFSSGRIRVAEYYWVEETERTLVTLTSGITVDEDELLDEDEIQMKDGMPVMRRARTPRVMYTKISALEELEPRRRIPGRYVPIIPVYGRQGIVDGKRQVMGLVRDMRGPQRIFNYATNKIIEAVSLAPMAPWVVAEGQIEGYEQFYQQSNTRPIAYLPYRTVDLMGKPAPPPQRQTADVPIAAMVAVLAQSDQNLKAVSGYYPESLGEPKNDESGKAILARQQRGDVANLHLSDNFNRSLRHAVKVKLAMIPEIWDTARIQRIIDPDETHRMVKLNQPFEEEGMLKVFDVRVAQYDVVISAGPSYHSKRAEFVSSVLSLVQAAPETMSLVLDLLVQNMDWPGAQEIADRLRQMLPPQLQKPDPNSDEPQIPPQAQQKITQLMQQNAQLIQALQQATSTIETKRLQYESDRQLTEFKGYIDVLKALISSKSSEATALMQADFGAVKHRIDTLGDIAEREAMQGDPANAPANGATPAGSGTVGPGSLPAAAGPPPVPQPAPPAAPAPALPGA